MRELSDVEVVCLAKACGESRVAKARLSLPNDTTHQVDFTVRLTGTLTRGVAIADSIKLVTEKLEVDRQAVHLAALKKLGVTAAEYRAAYESAESRAIAALAKKQTTIKPTKIPVRGRDGDITVLVDVQRV